MKSFSEKIIAIVFILVSFAGRDFAQQGNVVQQVDTVMNQFVKLKMFSGVVLIAVDNKPLYQKAFGFENPEKKIPNKTNTKFSIGTATKFFTAILISQLEEEGKIKFTDTVDKYIPGFSSEAGSKITIMNLLDERSGLGNYADDPGFRKKENEIKSVDGFLPFIKKEKLKFIPGTKMSLSSSGYVVLAAVIEKIYGKSFEEVLKEKILQPLKMDNTGFNINTSDSNGFANGYKVLLNGELKDSLNENSKGAGNIGIYTTAADMLKLDYSLANDTLILSNGSKLELFTKNFSGTNKETWNDYSSKETFGIEGSLPGFETVWYRFFREKYSIIVLSNINQPSALDATYFVKMILFGRPFSLPRVSPSRFVYNEIEKNGIKYFLANYGKLFHDNRYEISDYKLFDEVGQELFSMNKKDWAIEILKLNASLFNYVPTVFNSLGDAYRQLNNRSEAIANYKKALRLDPANDYAVKMLAKLGAL